ncbi:MAG: hypothetical protein M3Y26_04730, partial [Actinomycetota bacterium]|nr:hypothetical protein [Actinomycetota bacterium]
GSVSHAGAYMVTPLPVRVGPVEFEPVGPRMVKVRAPRELAAAIINAGGEYDPGCKVWWVERRRIGPLVRALERKVDPLFRRVGMRL